MITQRQDLIARRTPRRHRHRRADSGASLDPDTRLRVPLRNVDARAPRVDYLHNRSFRSAEAQNNAAPGSVAGVCVSGRAGWNNNMTPGLTGNIPRYPWRKGPSLAKLRCGLTGTVVEPGSAETH